MCTSPTSCSRRSIRPCAACALPGGAPVVLADTVGFIRELPHELVAAFQSTLQEAREAHLLLHVVDASDPRRDEHIEQVDTVLREIGAGDIPQLRVYNKIDRLERRAETRARRRRDGLRGVDRRGAGPAASRCCARRSASGWRSSVQRLWMHLPPGAGALRARLYAGRVVRDERALEDGASGIAGGAARTGPDRRGRRSPACACWRPSRCRAQPLVRRWSPT